MGSLQRGRWKYIGLMAALAPHASMARTTSFLVTRPTTETAPLATQEIPAMEVVSTVVADHEELSSIIEAEATLDITADEAPADVEIIGQLE